MTYYRKSKIHLKTYDILSNFWGHYKLNKQDSKQLNKCRYKVISNKKKGKKTEHKLDFRGRLASALNLKGFSGKYSLIYRGSGKDKGCNDYADYAGIMFLGEWKTNNNSLKLSNKNYGIKCKQLDYRTAGMVQTICRTRIRKHSGEEIWVFYSDDIDMNLIQNTFNFFVLNSTEGTIVEGVPMPLISNRASSTMLKVSTLCQNYPDIFEAISKRKPLSRDITLAEMQSLFPLKEGKSRSHKALINQLKKHYNITLRVKP